MSNQRMKSDRQMMLVDSHCHLDFPELTADRAGVLARAEEKGVTTLLTICTRIKKFDQISEIARENENIFATVGTHPHNAADENDVSENVIIKLSERDEVVGIGETGLDFYYDNSPRKIQEAVFRSHISAAKKTGLPLVIHTRSADKDMVRILDDELKTGGFTGVLHCFSSGPELAEWVLEKGFYLSFSGILTFNKAEELREIASHAPLNRVLVETDAPFLAPVPNRGRTNEPSYVVHTAKKLADIYGISLADIAAVTTENFFRLFPKARRPVKATA